MRRAFLFALSLSLALLLAGAAASAQSREEREVRALLDRFFAATNTVDARQAQQILADHSRSGGPYFPPFAAALHSLAELEALANQSLAQTASRSYRATGPITVNAVNRMAWAAYPWRLELRLKDGTRIEQEGRATVVFVREGDDWKFAHWHSSVVAPAPRNAAAQEAEADAIIGIEREAWEAIQNRNADALAGYFADGASLFQEGSAYRMTGKANLLRGLTAHMQATQLRSFQLLEPRVEIYGDLALLTYYFTEAGVADGKNFSNAGKSSVVFIKQDGAWRALHEHRSLNR